MSNVLQHTEGIILQMVPFRDHDQILTLFTHHVGILKLFFKGNSNIQRKLQGPYAPFTVVEVIYREKNHELMSCHEISVIQSNYFLRQNLTFLEVAGDLLKIVQVSQINGKSAPLLYQLLRDYISRIPQMPDPWVLTLSFRLKVLKHEGLLSLPCFCTLCQMPILNAGYTHQAGWRCLSCPRQELGLWTYWIEEEILLAYHLTQCRYFHELKISSCSQELRRKIDLFFQDCFGTC